MDLLRLTDITILDIKENDHDYAVKIKSMGSQEVCNRCVGLSVVKNGTKKNQYFWDVPISGKRVRLVIDRQKFKCKSCGQTWLEELLHFDDKRKMTTRLIEYINDNAINKNRTFASLAEEIGVAEPTVKNVFSDAIIEFEKNFNPETPKWLGIDEIYLVGKPRGIITNVSENTVIDLLKSRKQATVVDYLYNMTDRDNIEVVTMDMWNPYRNAVKTVLPNAHIVVDKFHIVRMANQALEQVRKDLRKTLTSTQRKTLKNERFVLLKRRHDLSFQEQVNMQAWTKSFPTLGMAYDLKESFYDIWDIEDKETAKNVLDAWVMSIPTDVLKAFNPLITAISNWNDEIFNYYDYKVTNAYTESLNSVIRHIDRIGRGYSFDVIRAKLLYSKGIRKASKPKFDDSLILFDEPMPAMSYMVSESQRSYQMKDYGADLSTILRKLEEGAL